jgi:Tat protein translocase TatB subunit
MFEIGFSELLLILVIALMVLGPKRLPGLVAQVGRWAGKARNMARQFREQLETEINLEELNTTAAKPAVPPVFDPTVTEPYVEPQAASPAEPAVTPHGEPAVPLHTEPHVEPNIAQPAAAHDTDVPKP